MSKYLRKKAGLRLIEGVNPSIARLVHALMCWGVRTTDSHAGFYPGDEEEIEYWAQKIGLERIRGISISGPIVLAGGGYNLPYVKFKATREKAERLEKILTNGWIVYPYYRKIGVYIVEYEALEEFQIATDDFWQEKIWSKHDNYEEELPLELYQLAEELNEEYNRAMPLNPKEFNAVRNKAVEELTLKIYNDLMNHSVKEVKERLDQLLDQLGILA